MRFKYPLLILAIVGVSGCATTIPSKWYNPQIKDSFQQTYQLREDMSVCMDVARGTTPMPAARTYIPIENQASYRFNGRVTTYGANGPQTSTVSGRATRAPSFNSGFASGYNAGIAMRAAMEERKFNEAYVSCMETLGWTDEEPDDQEESNGLEVGDECNASSECAGILVCAKASESSMQCMSSDEAIRSMN